MTQFLNFIPWMKVDGRICEADHSVCTAYTDMFANVQRLASFKPTRRALLANSRISLYREQLIYQGKW